MRLAAAAATTPRPSANSEAAVNAPANHRAFPPYDNEPATRGVEDEQSESVDLA